MPFSRYVRRSLHLAGLVAVMFMATIAVPALAHADATSTVVYDGAGDAPQIGLIGDSTLSGVRWEDDFGDLRQYNFVFDSASCRRIVERSCWSREDYRPETALQRMQELSGRWGEVLVVMSGYNDSGHGFEHGVEAIIAEAKSQGISKVMWLTMRTAEVSYEDPLHLTNVDTYRGDNDVLREQAAQHGGYLQLADWTTYSADESGWFTYDGVHLTPEGVDGVTTFIADQVGLVLAGETVTPPAPPWEPLGEGDAGSMVADVQQALIDAGFSSVGGVDGNFGARTTEAVRTFQQRHGITASGVVDEPTAVALGVFTTPKEVSAEAASIEATPLTTMAAPPATSETITTAVDDEASASLVDGGGIVIAPAAVGASAVLALRIRRRGTRSRVARTRGHRNTGQG